MSVELTEDLGYSPQEIEFTFESEKSEDLYILQIRDQDMATHQSVDVFKASIEKMKLVGRGIGVGGGAMNGRVAFDNSDITKLKKKLYLLNLIIFLQLNVKKKIISLLIILALLCLHKYQG